VVDFDLPKKLYCLLGIVIPGCVPDGSTSSTPSFSCVLSCDKAHTSDQNADRLRILDFVFKRIRRQPLIASKTELVSYT
jgi:hypothetical protein